MRKALELVTTAHPAEANRGSISAAIEASRAAKITLGAPSGVAGETRMSATFEGMAVLISSARLRRRAAFGPVRSRQPCDFKPGMMLKHLNEALSDNSGSAQDSYGDFRSHISFLRFYNTGRSQPLFRQPAGHLTVLTDLGVVAGLSLVQAHEPPRSRSLKSQLSVVSL